MRDLGFTGPGGEAGGFTRYGLEEAHKNVAKRWARLIGRTWSDDNDFGWRVEFGQR